MSIISYFPEKEKDGKGTATSGDVIRGKTFSANIGNNIRGTLIASEAMLPQNDINNFLIRTSPVDNPWQSVCYGNGLFVAVASSGAGNRVMTSPDGITWTIRTSAADNAWLSVCYGNGLFVAVASSGTGDRVMTSPDGISWTLRNSGIFYAIVWYSVCYSNGLFVAAGGGGAIATSPTGGDWSMKSLSAVNNWKSICYGNGTFVAIGDTASAAATMRTYYEST